MLHFRHDEGLLIIPRFSFLSIARGVVTFQCDEGASALHMLFFFNILFFL